MIRAIHGTHGFFKEPEVKPNTPKKSQTDIIFFPQKKSSYPLQPAVASMKPMASDDAKHLNCEFPWKTGVTIHCPGWEFTPLWKGGEE